MRTSLNDIQHMEEFLSGNLSPEESLMMQARLLSEPALQLNMQAQKKVYAVIKAYSRKQLRTKLESVHRSIFQDPEKKEFRQKIYQLFKYR